LLFPLSAAGSGHKRASSQRDNLFIQNAPVIRGVFCNYISIMVYRVSAIGLDNAALEIIDDKYRILTNDNNSAAQKCYWKNDKYITENIICTEFKNVEELYEKC